jgi:hypothetical protein
MDRALQPTANYKRCSKCKSTIDAPSSYATCLPCRVADNFRRQKRLKMEKMNTTVQADLDLLKLKYGATGASVKERLERQENATQRDGSRKPSAGVKRKAQKSLSELEGEERKVALKMTKTSLDKSIRQQGKKPLPTTSAQSVSDFVFCLMKVPLLMCT